MRNRLLLLCLVVSLCACGKHGDDDDDNGASCPDGGTGTLTITVDGGGVTPTIQITGPNGFTNAISSTETLSDVDGGTYTLMAETVITPAAGSDLAGTVYSATPESVVAACVRDGQTETVSVNYAEHPGSGMLWVAQNGGGGNSDAVAYDQSKLTGPGTQSPDISLDLASGNPSNNVVGMAFDAWGNLWLASASTSGDRIAALTPEQLATGGDLDPETVITSSAFQYVRDITLDADGNLWASNGDSDTVVELSAAQLAAALVSGELEVSEAPVVSIESADFDSPHGIEIDASGNLWVANRGANNVLEIAAADLTVSGTPAAATAITGDTPSPVVTQLTAPTDLVFQPDGDLWVSYLASNVLARYTPAQLAASGNYEPDPQTTVPVSAIPYGIAVDAQGGVWSAQYEFRLQRTDAAEYTVDSNELGDPQKLTFYPAP